MSILFFTVADKRSRDIESQAALFAQQGRRVSLLTLSGWCPLHDVFVAKGWRAEARSVRPKWLPFHLLTEVFFLVRYCKRNQIDVLHAHLDPCNLIAVCSHFFMKTRVFVTRHHAEALEYESSAQGRWISKWMYRMAPAIIAVSANVKRYLTEREGVHPARVSVIPLSFDFSLYDKPDAAAVSAIRSKMGRTLTLITVGRLTSLKRVNLLIELTGKLLADGVDCSLMVVGCGPDEKLLQAAARSAGLEDRIFFTGFTDRVAEYLSAADVYVHFSVTEATCTAVKEAAWAGLPAIVCREVGDFEEYIVHGRNGFLVSKEQPVNEARAILREFGADKAKLRQMGESLRETVLTHFDINRRREAFENLHSR
jgi:glycosyltransferase involved in cell wall biosynthesis